MLNIKCMLIYVYHHFNKDYSYTVYLAEESNPVFQGVQPMYPTAYTCLKLYTYNLCQAKRIGYRDC